MEEEIKESILCRFIINVTQEEKKPDRLFFHLQNAYWYYLDFLLPKDPLPQLEFYQILLQSLPEFIDIKNNLKFYLKKHKQYAKTIPLFGAILLNETLESVLLVMNYNLTVYSFPKGKVNKGETGIDCAKREVWEEVGYDISKKISEKEYLEFICEETGQPQRMYIISGVDENHKFTTSTRFEIGLIEWVKINEIRKSDGRFVYLQPFIQGLQKYIHTRLTQKKQQVQNTNEQDYQIYLNDKTNHILKQFKHSLKSTEPRLQKIPQFKLFKLII